MPSLDQPLVIIQFSLTRLALKRTPLALLSKLLLTALFEIVALLRLQEARAHPLVTLVIPCPVKLLAKMESSLPPPAPRLSAMPQPSLSTELQLEIALLNF